MTNIISLADISINYRVTLDTTKEIEITVHLKDKLVKSNELPGGFYRRELHVIANEINIHNYQNYYIEEIKNDKETYLSKTKLLKAKNTKQVMLALGSPSSKNLKKIINMKFIKDNSITCEDVYGPNQGSIKGRTIQKNMKIEQYEKIEIPCELMVRNRYIEISADIMHINLLMFMASVSQDLFYRTSQFIPNKNKQTNSPQYNKRTIKLYKNNNFNITELYDGLKIFNSIKIEIICPPVQAHVSKAECNKRTASQDEFLQPTSNLFQNSIEIFSNGKYVPTKLLPSYKRCITIFQSKNNLYKKKA